MKRIICLVADGLGVGALPDASLYGDEGSNTLAHTASAVQGLRLQNLEKLGLGNIGHFEGIRPSASPLALVGRMAEKSAGKDTTTGHWEIAGLVTSTPFALFPNGFPPEIVDKWVNRAGIPGILGNKAASGTEIIKELGDEHVRTRKPILYTSADSVFQVACHEEDFGLKELYRICELAREITLPHRIGRVIARPFIGKDSSSFVRTQNRRDYSIAPARNLLDVLGEKGIDVVSVGKIEDLFAHRSISDANHTGNNPDSLKVTLDFMRKKRGKEAFIFVNLVDFDMLYGHRRDAKGYARALIELDNFLPTLFQELTPEDLFILTSDHGCDPTFKGTDHTREYVPLIVYRPSNQGGSLGDRTSFSDVAATVLNAYGLQGDQQLTPAKSFFSSVDRGR